MRSNVITRRRLRRMALLALPLSLGACDWFTDFKQQPSVNTWQELDSNTVKKGSRGQPSHSVGTNGTLAPGYGVSYSQLPITIDSLAGIANPVAADARSLLNGRKYYQINCAVCHGASGDGKGTLAAAGYPIAPNLLLDLTKGRTDGYIWGMMRNGRGLMPSANRIEEAERWDVVNYVRGLQGKYAVDTTAVGRPGETGDKLPGFTKLGPTIPAPYFHPNVKPREAKGDAHGEAKATETKKEGHE